MSSFIRKLPDLVFPAHDQKAVRIARLVAQVIPDALLSDWGANLLARDEGRVNSSE